MGTTKLKREINMTDGLIIFTDMTKKNGDGTNPSLTIDVTKFPPEMQKRAEFHGWNAKLGDTVAGMKDDEDMLAAISAVAASVMEKNWSIKGSGGSGPKSSASQTRLATALHQVYSAQLEAQGKPVPTYDEVFDRVAAMSKEERKAFGELAPVKAIVLELIAKAEAEKAKAAKRAAKEGEEVSLENLFAA